MPIVKTKTDAAGNFKLGDPIADVPVGANIPLVIQVGKWRREVTIANVPACADTPLTDTNLTRLPRNQSEGHLPKIALTTGGADALECLLRKIGIDDTEFTTPAGHRPRELLRRHRRHGSVQRRAGRRGVHVRGAVVGRRRQPAQVRHDPALVRRDREPEQQESGGAATRCKAYADGGGRVFASHWHNYWFERGPAPWPMIANFSHQADLPIPFTATIDTSFQRGRGAG